MNAHPLTRRQIIALMKPLRDTLHYWQMMGRMDRKAIASDAKNVRHYAAQLRALQKLLEGK